MAPWRLVVSMCSVLPDGLGKSWSDSWRTEAAKNIVDLVHVCLLRKHKTARYFWVIISNLCLTGGSLTARCLDVFSASRWSGEVLISFFTHRSCKADCGSCALRISWDTRFAVCLQRHLLLQVVYLEHLAVWGAHFHHQSPHGRVC